MGGDIIVVAATEPIAKGIVPAVLLAGLIFLCGRKAFDREMRRLFHRMPLKAVIFAIVVVLGLLSSVITAIIAALLLVELANLLPLDQKAKTNLVIISCFSLGLGAALTPLGEPLSTIAVVNLRTPV